MLKIMTDGSGQRYVEVPTIEGECLRLTYIDAEHSGYKTQPAVRVRIRAANGKLLMGPDIPLSSMADFRSALEMLLE